MFDKILLDFNKFYLVLCLLIGLGCAAIIGCANNARVIDNADIAISAEINRELLERNELLEAELARRNESLVNIERIAESATNHAGEARNSLADLERLLRVYFKAVRDIQDELGRGKENQSETSQSADHL